MARQTKEDWLQIGFVALAQEGAGGLTIAALTARLNVTKGSFYHHFKSADDYKTQLLDFWEQQGTERLIIISEAEHSHPIAVIDNIMSLAIDYPDDPEVALRAWAMQDAQVRTYQQRIDQRRMSYACQLFEAHTGDPDQALLMSQLLYSIIVATEQIIPPIRGAAFQRLYTEFKRLYDLP